MTNKKMGFTLMELLVVVAILGILSAISLLALNSARIKGMDTNVKANLNTVRSEMELYYLNDNNYGEPAVANSEVCKNSEQPFTSNPIEEAILEAEANSDGDAVCAVGVETWAVSVPLRGGGSWCVSSVGTSGIGLASGGGDTPTSDPASCQ